ncbi:MAG: phosphoribosyltransferase family protein [Ekhidna sp.]|uniref:ComF family protein n=1 Tax=Ekhidna sp. TaxID=2608089 RepID=UPI0032EF719B
MLQDLIALIFPQNCINCDQSLNSVEKFLCTPCKIDLPFTNDVHNPDNELLRKFSFEPKVKSASSYLYFHRGGVTQKLLHHLKYKGKKDLGVELGKWFAPSLRELPIDLVVPVPLHKSKLRKRTFNQSEQISIGISEVLNAEVKSDLAKRIIATETQTKKSKVQRWTNMENVYAKISEDLSGQSALVVDDVITTGATTGMLCQRLVEANVKEIHIVSIARGK